MSRGVLAFALGSALLCAGCVERVLLVETDPPGARVTVNGIPRGVTPARIRYVHEGRFDLRIEKDGYQSIATEVTTCTRLDAVPGPDFIAENVWPGTIRRRTRAAYRMTPLPKESYTREELLALVGQARDFRAKARAAVAEPGTPRPTPPGQRSRAPVQPFPGAQPTR